MNSKGAKNTGLFMSNDQQQQQRQPQPEETQEEGYFCLPLKIFQEKEIHEQQRS